MTLKELKDLKKVGHTIDSVIAMLERKEQYKKQNKHWFIIKNGRNVCEFCGCLYVPSSSETMCNSKVHQ